MSIPEFLRSEVKARAGNRCKYCGLCQEGQEATFHVDHIHPVSLGGETSLENLALACVSCSLRKGARHEFRDPETGLQVPLYHPRSAPWNLHYRWIGAELVGVSATGRATISALGINRLIAINIRQQEQRLGRHPPPGQL